MTDVSNCAKRELLGLIGIEVNGPKGKQPEHQQEFQWQLEAGRQADSTRNSHLSLGINFCILPPVMSPTYTEPSLATAMQCAISN